VHTLLDYRSAGWELQAKMPMSLKDAPIAVEEARRVSRVG
jgi:hypothetical protein